MPELNQIELDGVTYQLSQYKEIPQGDSDTYGIVKISDSIDSSKTADGGWALSPAVYSQAQIGTFIQGHSLTTGALGNGKEGDIGYIDIPSSGVWFINASGWWPDGMSTGYLYINNVGATGTVQYQYNIAGIAYLNAGRVYLKAVNWSGGTLPSVTSAGLMFRATKIGLG